MREKRNEIIVHRGHIQQFLQQLNGGELPPALLHFKVGCPVILLRNLDPGEGFCAETLPMLLKRLQFPVRLVFAMTINKSQGQSVEHMGINLQTSVFSHRQLYVVFLRCTSSLNISVLLPEQSQESRM